MVFPINQIILIFPYAEFALIKVLKKTQTTSSENFKK